VFHTSIIVYVRIYFPDDEEVITLKKMLSLLIVVLLALAPLTAAAEADEAADRLFWEHMERAVQSYDPDTQALTIDFGTAMFAYQPSDGLTEFAAYLGPQEYVVQLGSESLWVELSDDGTVFEVPYAALSDMFAVNAASMSAAELDTEAFQQIGMMFATIVLAPGFTMEPAEAGLHIHYERTLPGFLQDVMTFGDTLTTVDRYADAIGGLLDQTGALPTGTTGREAVDAYWPEIRAELEQAAVQAAGSVAADIDAAYDPDLSVHIDATIEADGAPLTLAGSITGDGTGTAYDAEFTLKDDMDTGLALNARLELGDEVTLVGTTWFLAPEAQEIASFNAAFATDAVDMNAWTPGGWRGSLTLAARSDYFGIAVNSAVNGEDVFTLAVKAESDETHLDASAYLLSDGGEWSCALKGDDKGGALTLLWPGSHAELSVDAPDEENLDIRLEYTGPDEAFTAEYDGKSIVITDGANTVVITGEAQSDSLYIISAAFEGDGVEAGEYEMLLELTDQEGGWVMSLSDEAAAYAVISCGPANIVPLSALEPAVLDAQALRELLQSALGM